jgi:fucose permease
MVAIVLLVVTLDLFITTDIPEVTEGELVECYKAATGRLLEKRSIWKERNLWIGVKAQILQVGAQRAAETFLWGLLVEMKGGSAMRHHFLLIVQGAHFCGWVVSTPPTNSQTASVLFLALDGAASCVAVDGCGRFGHRGSLYAFSDSRF